MPSFGDEMDEVAREIVEREVGRKGENARSEETSRLTHHFAPNSSLRSTAHSSARSSARSTARRSYKRVQQEHSRRGREHSLSDDANSRTHEIINNSL